MSLLDDARARRWYHSIELAPGVVTEGWWDHRPTVPAFGLPERMDGMRALDVGTWDGFWAFEMERRGAEVVALDLDREDALDWPPRKRPATFSTEMRGDGFRLAKEVLGSKVERVDCSIYHATPEELGTFDVVFCASVIMHLRDQYLALERIAGLCKGLFISTEEYDRVLSLLPFPASRYYADRPSAVVFWLPSVRCWERMIWSVGFDDVQVKRRMKLETRAKDLAVRHVLIHARKG